MTTSYAYVHCKPDGTPFYVGKGVRGRYKNFRDRNPYHKKIVAKYGEQNILIGKMDCSNNDIALSLEIGIIKCLRNMGLPLANLTDGGEGNVGWKCPETVKKAVAKANATRVWSKEQRKKLGDKTRGIKRPEHSVLMKSKKHWDGNKNPFFGMGINQAGSKNHMARAVVGNHPLHGIRAWGTLKEASIDLGVTIQAIAQALKKNQKSKGWTLEYLK